MSDDPILAARRRLEAGLTRLEAGQDMLRDDLMDRLDRLQDALTAIREDMRVNFSAIDTVQACQRQTPVTSCAAWPRP